MLYQTNRSKVLNIESWSVKDVCRWLEGIGDKAIGYIENFEAKNINGKKLFVLDKEDLIDLGIDKLDHRIKIYNLIQDLIQIKYDLNNETLHTLISNVRNRVICILRYVEKLDACNCRYIKRDSSCLTCIQTRHDIFKLTSILTTSYRRLLSWLARLPFTRIPKLDRFRNEINSEMKVLLKLFRKCSKNDDFYVNLNRSLFRILDCCGKVLDITNVKFKDPDAQTALNSEEMKTLNNENKKASEELARNSVMYNYCYLEKAVIVKRSAEQVLGLSLAKLIDGISTVGEIEKESASDECSRLNVGDDILAINDHVIVGWSTENIFKLLQTIFESYESLVLLLRKMPREQSQTLKQQRAVIVMNTLPKKRSSKECRKHSFADVFLSDQEILDGNSSEDEDEIPIFGTTRNSGRYINPVDSRRIQSMDNLIIDKSRSRSNSIENNNLLPEISKQRKKSDDTDSTKTDFTSKSDIIRSFIPNKRFNIDRSWDLFHRKKQSSEPPDSSTPSLLNIKKLDSAKMQKLTDTNNNKLSKSETIPVFSKPPIDKKVYKTQQKQKPIYQSWLYKRKPHDKRKHHHNIIRNINSKWQRYWCILMKDHIIFNKHPDDKTPKDFILLKEFEIIRTQRQYGFIIIDNSKDTTHEFYAENNEEYKDWYQSLFDLRIKLSGQDYNSQSQSKQNLNDDYQKLQNSQINNILQSNNSSRESSPGASSSKIPSRDGSPVLNYYNSLSKNGGTSESECDTDVSKQQLSSSSAFLNTKSKFETKVLPNSVSNYHNGKDSSFTDLKSLRDDSRSDLTKPEKKERDFNKITQQSNSFDLQNFEQLIDEQQRCSSLPGSYQKTTGSYLNERFNNDTSSNTPTHNDNFMSLPVNNPKSNVAKDETQMPRVTSCNVSFSTTNNNKILNNENYSFLHNPPVFSIPPSYTRHSPLLTSIFSKKQLFSQPSTINETVNAHSPTIFRTELTILPSNLLKFRNNNNSNDNNNQNV